MRNPIQLIVFWLSCIIGIASGVAALYAVTTFDSVNLFISIMAMFAMIFVAYATNPSINN